MARELVVRLPDTMQRHREKQPLANGSFDFRWLKCDP